MDRPAYARRLIRSHAIDDSLEVQPTQGSNVTFPYLGRPNTTTQYVNPRQQRNT